MRSIGKHRFALLFVCAIALQAFVGLVAAELILRIIDLRYLRLETSANTLPYQHDPEIGWVPIANSVSAFTGSRKIAVQQNSLGLRDLENDGSEKPAIMFVGTPSFGDTMSRPTSDLPNCCDGGCHNIELSTPELPDMRPIRNICFSGGCGARPRRK